MRAELGRGAMGVVYEAFDPVLAPPRGPQDDPPRPPLDTAQAHLFEERFLVEARIAARLQHPGIVVVHDVGRDEATGILYIALELLRGRTLQQILNDGPLAWPDALRLVARVAQALDHAHGEGIIHRDIKPANVMVLPSGEPKIMDFGIARVENAGATSRCRASSSEPRSTPRPSRPSARPSTHAATSSPWGPSPTRPSSDGPPSARSSIPQIVHKVVKVDPPPPSTQVEGLPRVIDGVLARAMAKSPDARYATAADFAQELEALLLEAGPLTLTSAPPRRGQPVRSCRPWPPRPPRRSDSAGSASAPSRSGDSPHRGLGAPPPCCPSPRVPRRSAHGTRPAWPVLRVARTTRVLVTPRGL